MLKRSTSETNLKYYEEDESSEDEPIKENQPEIHFEECGEESIEEMQIQN